MKMLKSLLTLCALIAVFSTGVFAQPPTGSEVSEDVIATAEVLSTLSVDWGGAGESNTIDFGGLVKDDYTAIVAPDGGLTNTGSGAHPASGTITGASGAEIYVTFTNGTMAHEDNAGDKLLAVTTAVEIEGTDITSGTTYPLGSAESAVTVGGAVTIASGTTEGAYSTANTGGSPITLTFNYN